MAAFMRWLHRIANRILFYTQIFVKKIQAMHIFEKILVIWLLFVTFILLFFPLFVITPNDVVNSSSQFIFFVMNASLLKTWILVQGMILLLLLYAFHHPFKVYVADTLGFHGRSYLLYVLGVIVALTWFVGMGDMMSLYTNQTTILQPTWMYYGVQIMLIILLWFTCYVLFTQHTKKHYKWHVVWYHDKKHKDQDNAWWLFE